MPALYSLMHALHDDPARPPLTHYLTFLLSLLMACVPDGRSLPPPPLSLFLISVPPPAGLGRLASQDSRATEPGWYAPPEVRLHVCEQQEGGRVVGGMPGAGQTLCVCHAACSLLVSTSSSHVDM
jgi:hypothetical protein